MLVTQYLVRHARLKKQCLEFWLVRLVVRTADFHSADPGPIPGRATKIYRGVEQW